MIFITRTNIQLILTVRFPFGLLEHAALFVRVPCFSCILVIEDVLLYFSVAIK